MFNNLILNQVQSMFISTLCFRDDSSDDEEPVRKGKRHKEEKEADIGKVVCVEVSEKKKQKDNWFPGLVVAPTAQDTVRIHVREDYLVRSFKDGR